MTTRAEGVMGEPRGTRSSDDSDLQSGCHLFQRPVDSISGQAVYILDPHGRVASWNVGAERIKGWRAEEIVGRPFSTFSTFFTPEDVAAALPRRLLDERG
jgi:PAS domain-containing protein